MYEITIHLSYCHFCRNNIKLLCSLYTIVHPSYTFINFLYLFFPVSFTISITISISIFILFFPLPDFNATSFSCIISISYRVPYENDQLISITKQTSVGDVSMKNILAASAARACEFSS